MRLPHEHRFTKISAHCRGTRCVLQSRTPNDLVWPTVCTTRTRTPHEWVVVVEWEPLWHGDTQRLRFWNKRTQNVKSHLGVTVTVSFENSRFWMFKFKKERLSNQKSVQNVRIQTSTRHSFKFKLQQERLVVLCHSVLSFSNKACGPGSQFLFRLVIFVLHTDCTTGHVANV